MAESVEGAPLLREYGVKSSIEGSNPSLSANPSQCKNGIPRNPGASARVTLWRKPAETQNGGLSLTAQGLAG